nr:DUF296 domain-containing protein [Catalinimonas alkaloidigena]
MPAAVPTTVRLTPGQDLRQELLRLTEQNGWEAACIVSCAGSVSTTALRLANQPDATVYEGHAEIIALSGTLSVNGSHLHLAVSDSTGKTLGGHLMDGSRIYTTAEIVIAPLPHQRFTREPDPTSGYYELVVKAVAHQP